MHIFVEKMCECDQRYVTMDPLNPDLVGLISFVMPGKAARYVQYDLGVEGVPVTSVRVFHWHRYPEYLLYSNNMIVYAIDPAGTVVFQYTFTGMNANSPIYDDFDMTGQKLSPGTIPYP